MTERPNQNKKKAANTDSASGKAPGEQSRRSRRRKRGSSNRHRRRGKKPLERIVPAHNKIALIGFRGVGKSTIANELARFWEVEIISLDKHIAKTQGTSIEDLVAQRGWDAFRKMEYDCLVEFAGTEKAILLDTGGGIVEGYQQGISEDKIDILKERYFTIYLYMSDERLLQRLARARRSANRPPLTGEASELLQILQKRKPWYQKAAHAVVDITDATAVEAAERIHQLLKAKKRGRA